MDLNIAEASVLNSGDGKGWWGDEWDGEHNKMSSGVEAFPLYIPLFGPQHQHT